jgi:hypothetical protein
LLSITIIVFVSSIDIIVVALILLGFPMETIVNQSPFSCVSSQTHLVNLLSFIEEKD